jgi:hypothetical protein
MARSTAAVVQDPESGNTIVLTARAIPGQQNVMVTQTAIRPVATPPPAGRGPRG